jgi:hypothetical protein
VAQQTPGRKKRPHRPRRKTESPRHRFHLYQYHIEKMERLLGTPMLSELLVDYVGETDLIGQQGFRRRSFSSVNEVYECSNGLPVATLPIWTGPFAPGLILSTYHMPCTTMASSPLKGTAAVSAVAPTAYWFVDTCVVNFSRMPCWYGASPCRPAPNTYLPAAVP